MCRLKFWRPLFYVNRTEIEIIAMLNQEHISYNVALVEMRQVIFRSILLVLYVENEYNAEVNWTETKWFIR